MIIPHLFDLINDHRDEIGEWSIQLNMRIHFNNPTSAALLYAHHIKSNTEEIRFDRKTDKIVTMLLKSFMNKYQKEKDISKKERNLIFNCTDSFSYCIYRKKPY